MIPSAHTSRAQHGRFASMTFALSLLIFASSLTAAPRLDVPYVPTPPDVVHRMLEMADVQPDDHLIDLGSGDGRIVIAAVRDFGVQDARGIDLDPERVAKARANAEREGVTDRTTFEQGNLFEKDLSDATVLSMYLLSTVNARLRPVILETMAPGTRIVSHSFDMGPWEPDEFDTVNGARIYLWIVPAQVGGRWQLTMADGEQATLMLQQNYQQLHASADRDGSDIAVTDASLKGDEIRFAIGLDQYVGKVEDDRIVAADGSDAEGWHAERL
ncbi:SAM-dependent methyltransferase [Pseudomonas saliphila]|uniref:SAM-dependent methyltransferase n=1 Tax=Pseudomonas saliphila TaxID=2586906 RepID=UPI001F1B1DBD|nr:class I SAM-dependent methyltransferase [Pseudomonas saliphila]